MNYFQIIIIIDMCRMGVVNADSALLNLIVNL